LEGAGFLRPKKGGQAEEQNQEVVALHGEIG